MARRCWSVVRSPLAPNAALIASAMTSQSASPCSAVFSGASLGRPPMSCVLAIVSVHAPPKHLPAIDGLLGGGIQAAEAFGPGHLVIADESGAILGDDHA